MDFLQRFNERTKGTAGLLIVVAIAAYILGLPFINTTITLQFLGVYLAILGVMIIAILSELRGAQLFAVIILLFASRIASSMLIDGVSVFYTRLTAWGSFEWYHIVDFVASIYLLLKLLSLLAFERSSLSRISSDWMLILTVLTIYLYFTNGFASLLIILIPILAGFMLRQAKLTLLYILVLLINPLYSNIYQMINVRITVSNVSTVIFVIIFGFYVFRQFQAIDEDRTLN